jgi:hypothetical protein
VVVPPKPNEQGAARGAALGAMNSWEMVGAASSPHPGARRRRSRVGAAGIDECSHSEMHDATNRGRGVSRERRDRTAHGDHAIHCASHDSSAGPSDEFASSVSPKNSSAARRPSTTSSSNLSQSAHVV